MNPLPKKTVNRTSQQKKFPITDFFSKCDQILSFLRIWSHLLKKSVMENFILVQCRQKMFPFLGHFTFLHYIKISVFDGDTLAIPHDLPSSLKI